MAEDRREQNGEVIAGWRRVRLTRKIVEGVGEEQGLWYESREQAAVALRRGEARGVLLRWVQRQMARRLDARERQCVEMHFLEGRSFREVGVALGMTGPAVARTIRTAIERLRTVADRVSLPESRVWTDEEE